MSQVQYSNREQLSVDSVQHMVPSPEFGHHGFLFANSKLIWSAFSIVCDLPVTPAFPFLKVLWLF